MSNKSYNGIMRESSLISQNVYAVCFTEVDSVDILCGELSQVRKQLFELGKTVKVKKTYNIKGLDGRLSGKLSMHSLYWKKTSGKVILEESFSQKNGCFVLARDFDENIRVKISFLKDLSWQQSEYFLPGRYPFAQTIIRPMPDYDVIERSDYDFRSRAYIPTELFPSPYFFGKPQENLLTAKLGQPDVIVSCENGFVCYSQKEICDKRLAEIENLSDQTVVIMPAWEVKDGEISTEEDRVGEDREVIFSGLDSHVKLDSGESPSGEFAQSAEASSRVNTESISGAENNENVDLPFEDIQSSRAPDQPAAADSAPNPEAPEAAAPEVETEEPSPETKPEQIAFAEDSPSVSAQSAGSFTQDQIGAESESLLQARALPQDQVISRKYVDETAHATVEQANPEAEAAHVTAEQPKPEAEAAPVTAEQATPETEPAPVTAEQAKPEAETSPVTAEQPKPEAEAAHVTAEQATPETEPAPVTAEQAKTEAEAALVTKNPSEVTETSVAVRHSPFATRLYEDGSPCYVGSWKNGKKDGLGISFRNSDGAIHIAKWKNGIPGEFVSLFDSDGNLRYGGRIIDGKKQGAGVTYSAENGMVFVGKWKDNERTGMGSAFDSEGNLTYTGMWKDGKREGSGTEFDPDGNVVFCGEWKNDKYHNGILYKRLGSNTEAHDFIEDI